MEEPGVPQPTARYSRKREALLDAATGLLNIHGVRGLTLARAAAAVELSTTSVTYYFPRKDGLAAACMLRGLEELREMARLAVGEDRPARRIARLVELYVERERRAAAGEAPPLARFSDIRALREPYRGQVTLAYGEIFRIARGLFEAPELEALSHGRRTARTHMLMAQILWSATWLSRYPPGDYGRIAEAMTDMLVGGLAAPGTHWPQPPAPDLAGAAPLADVDAGREAFLLAATRLINTLGYRGASVELISAELSVTKGSFYHHHGAKDELVVDCFLRTFAIMDALLDRASELPGDSWSHLCAVAASLCAFQLSERGPLLRASALSALDPAISSQMLRRSEDLCGRFARLVAGGIAEGRIRPVDPEIAARLIEATLNAGAELGFWVPDIRPQAAPAVFARPLLMGVLSP